MVRYMLDATDCSQFRSSVVATGMGTVPISLRAGYINGAWPTAIQCGTDISIDVNGSRPDADVLDIEFGDATPDSAPDWVLQHNAKGGFPAVLYCNRSTIHAVANALDARGLNDGAHRKWWIATLDGTRTVPDMADVVAVQVFGSKDIADVNVDLSFVYDDSWKSTSPPPVPIPVPVEENEMYLAHITDNDDVFVVGEFSYEHVPDIPNLQSQEKLYGQPKDLTRDDWNAVSGNIDIRARRLQALFANSHVDVTVTTH